MKVTKLGTVLVAALVTAFALPGAASATTYRLSHNTSDTTTWHKGAEKFNELLKAKTDGKIDIRIFPNATLSGGDQMKQATMVSQGALDFLITSAINVTPLVPEMAVFSLPYLYADYKDVDATTTGATSDKMAEILAKKDIVMLAWGENGFREVTNNVRPIKTPADMKGLKMRVAGPMYIDVMNALGANPQQMQWTETFSALQQGVVDGQENPIGAVIIPQRVYEVQKYLTTWHYSYDPVFVGVSNKLWSSWDADTQAKVRAAAVEAMSFQKQLTRDDTAKGVQFLRDKGMEVYEPNADELMAFREATKPAFDTWAKKVGPDLVKSFQDAIKKAQ
ncbi:DctP family TRAP transporter solute-binding subunit [Pusillimonas sp. ANT_WB101]|uniref:DctP family TRAP transporter solute-binding subunit n=1 Tax=Pusillimonas sp. ANT_WB101 TaxID=2597356 RepID=UPI0011EF362E|nr:DctP family TRAP transporter solute-binding subunit [Pusillimonas sp. ANT_WB101]KAA0911159.1 DctP family TRAP transporter solute-binding subunit [Pusillimonas sp. ANT_WB101]